MFDLQYELIRKARETLFLYCESLTDEDYTKEISELGGKSIRHLHVHVADCYADWLSGFAMRREYRFSEMDYSNVSEVRAIFREVDQIMEAFLNRFGPHFEEAITRTVWWQEEPMTLSALWLFTHTITHEFHHKGQIVSIGRLLGCKPPTTDLEW